MADALNWVVCADDWGVHVSTTQHLASALARQDRVIWINSIGMRQPALRWKDARRLFQKLRRAGGQAHDHIAALEPAPVQVVHPHLFPWHMNPLARAASRVVFGRQLGTAMRRAGMSRPHVLTINPMLVKHLYFPHDKLIYLRLDDYALLPGTDPGMVRACEAEIFEKADIIFHTAELLKPEEARWSAKCRPLPQAVNVEHFASVPLDPPDNRVLGFFGLIAEWLDHDLIEAVAQACPDWTLELVGPVQYVSEGVRRMPNVRLIPPVAFDELPSRMAHWTAAWVPFRIDELTVRVNPLKMREYLAAGLPTLATPLPEAEACAPPVEIVRHAEDARAKLEQVRLQDTRAARAARRRFVQGDSWVARAETVRAAVR